MNTKVSLTIKDKILGALLGFAIGDAMGATTEFMTKEQIKRKYGCVLDILGGGWLNLTPGDITDDTQMTICVAAALMKYPTNLKLFKNQCIENFISWYNSNPKDIGKQCAQGISYYIQNEKYIFRDDTALGNGSLMRALPCALFGKTDFNVHQGLITHNNQKCSQIIQNYSRIIQNILDNNFIIKIKRSLLEPSGYILNTFNNSMYWASKNSFEEAIIGAVNDGGDADTIAAITGSIAGARFGIGNIPEKWIVQLNPYIINFFEKFCNFLCTN